MSIVAVGAEQVLIGLIVLLILRLSLGWHPLMMSSDLTPALFLIALAYALGVVRGGERRHPERRQPRAAPDRRDHRSSPARIPWRRHPERVNAR